MISEISMMVIVSEYSRWIKSELGRLKSIQDVDHFLDDHAILHKMINKIKEIIDHYNFLQHEINYLSLKRLKDLKGFQNLSPCINSVFICFSHDYPLALSWVTFPSPTTPFQICLFIFYDIISTDLIQFQSLLIC